MMSRTLKVVVALLAVLLLIPAALVRSPRGVGAADELYGLFLDWLRGKSMGLVTLNIVPVDAEGRPVKDSFLVIVHNFTDYESKPHSERIYIGPPPVTLKLWRKLDRWTGGWRAQEFTIILIGGKYLGAKYIRIVPERPLLTMDVKVEVTPIKRAPKVKALSAGGRLVGGFSLRGLRALNLEDSKSPEETKEITALSKAVQLHTIEGVWARVHFYIGNYLYYSQKIRYLEYDPDTGEYGEVTDWLITGDVATRCINTVRTATIGDGAKRWVCVYVTYRYERWLVPTYPNCYELVTPISFGGWAWGPSISCSLCGGSPSGGYAGYPQGTPTPFEIKLGPGVHKVETIGAKLTFTVAYGPVTVSIELWKEVSKGEAGSRPCIEVVSVDWKADTLYAFDAGTGWKVVHFTWESPS